MNVLVTGATGFVGRNAARALVNQGHQVRCLVRGESDLRPLQYLPVEIWRGDVLDPASLTGAMEEMQAVLHLVGIIKERPPQSTFHRIHVEGTSNLLQAAHKAGVPRFLYVSAIGAGPGPAFPYFHTKWEAEEAVRSSGLDWTIFRPSIAFGPGDGFLNQLAAIVRHPPAGDRTLAPFVPIIGSGKTRFQPIWVEDLARCFARALVTPETVGQTIELGGPRIHTYEELVDLVMDAISIHRPKLHVPAPLMRPAVTLMPLLYRDPPLTKVQLDMSQRDSVATLDSVERNFGFQPAALPDKIGYLREGG